jgi:UDP-GlcNAc:undecaprenyl-phosphate GlcNAc-1-phosphate transferase
LSLAILAFISGVPFDTSITSVLAGAIFAFLFFNMGWFKRGRYKVFMGDAGSMLIGLTVIWLVTFMVKVDMIRAVTVVWLIAIPLMDMFSVMMRRMLAGNSPLTASRDHFHHLFLRKGFSSSKTTTLIGIINALFCLVGIMSEIYVLPEYIMTGLFMIFFLVYNALVVREFERMN